MKSFQVYFNIIEDSRCPFYKVGDQLILTAKSLSCPQGKEACLILVREMTQLLFKLMTRKPEQLVAEKPIFTCSGCTGLIKFTPVAPVEALEAEKVPILGGRELRLLEKIGSFPLIHAIPEDHLRRIIGQFQQEIIFEGTTVIHKGETNLFLYMIISGQLLVVDGHMLISTLGAGDICGEMSCLGAGVAGATVRSLCDTEVLVFSIADFNVLLDNFPTVQNYMARLLAQRLTEVNKARLNDFSACMQGKIQEMAPAELFQIFHMNSKSGVLSLNLPRGHGSISFRDGCIINAHYQGLENEQAIFAMLGEHEGTYRFTNGLSPHEIKMPEIGDFMKLLMEGIKRVDDSLEK
jgi:CRP-like cAMP-binding protein